MEFDPETLRWKEVVVKEAIAQGLIGQEDGKESAMFFDLDVLRENVRQLLAAFPPHFSHFFAVKANPLKAVLEEVKKLGMGAEAASLGELQQALHCAFPSHKVVFDSPVKTKSEIRLALQQGILLNVDNFQELERISQMIKSGEVSAEKVKVGLRLNPQVGVGNISALSTATSTSKFGIPLKPNWDVIFSSFLLYPWLCAVHVHVGSQGCEFALIGEGIREVLLLAIAVNKKQNYQQIKIIDIGGGLPVNFSSDRMTPTFQDYSRFLQSRVPEIFTGQFQIMTEFGRAVMAKSGFTLSRVEYTKISGGRHIAAVHVGGDLLLRTIYHPEKWPLRVTVMSSQGHVKQSSSEEEVEWDVVGPLCFAGDIVAPKRKLISSITPGDFILIHDTGAYYHSSFSRYNSRQCPALYGFQNAQSSSLSSPQVKIDLWKSKESIHEVLQFFTSNL
eukprot:TRINITY_DN3947_c0_g1_i1.p1 TRINITY_DN3947_c0_g1~~TRINITY_DN3947_c0_g1_i1.p1  ORF type:complete len:446 (-),score=119.06 TRINITY_DN3947_c0_g1_i1:64-1401(-)